MPLNFSRHLRESGERHRVCLLIALCLLAASAISLIQLAWIPLDVGSFIDGQDGLVRVPDAKSNLRVSAPGTLDCINGVDCLEMADRQLALFEADWGLLDIFVNDTTEAVKLRAELQIDPSIFDPYEADQKDLALLLPQYRFQQAAIYVSGVLARTLYGGEPMAVPFPLIDRTSPLVVDIIFTIGPSQKAIAGFRNGQGIVIGKVGEIQKLVRFIEGAQGGASGAVGQISKIVLALFCLLLFVMIDSSPESLGLALFMGFEACALAIGKRWLPLGIFTEHRGAITHFCYQMGDIMKLYFLLQIARVGPTSALPWLGFGAAASFGYGLFMDYAAAVHMNWVFKIPRTRDTIVGGLGGLACFASLWMIRASHLTSRKMALLIAGIAGIGEVINSWIAHSQAFLSKPGVNAIYTIFQSNIGYLFTLSTFLNVSNLENRVRRLLKDKESHKEIERQLEVGQTVQKAFLTVPELPEELMVASFHKAATYVSGDTYFISFDEMDQTLTFLLNDVTGHGVQAAMKAFAANAIAKTIWTPMQDLGMRHSIDRRRRISRLEQFDRLIDIHLCRQEETPDFNAMIGIEFDLARESMLIYRANYNFPVLIAPDFNWQRTAEEVAPEHESWQVKPLTIENRTAVTLPFYKGSYIVAVSDGIISTGRLEHRLHRHLKNLFASSGQELEPEHLKESILEWMKDEEVKLLDDQTIVVFQWRPERVLTSRHDDDSLQAKVS